MASFLQRLAMPFLMGAARAINISVPAQIMPLAETPASVRLHRWSGAPGKSKRTVAQDQRRAAKTRARKRLARDLGADSPRMSDVNVAHDEGMKSNA